MLLSLLSSSSSAAVVSYTGEQTVTMEHLSPHFHTELVHTQSTDQSIHGFYWIHCNRNSRVQSDPTLFILLSTYTQDNSANLVYLLPLLSFSWLQIFKRYWRNDLQINALRYSACGFTHKAHDINWSYWSRIAVQKMYHRLFMWLKYLIRKYL